MHHHGITQVRHVLAGNMIGLMGWMTWGYCKKVTVNFGSWCTPSVNPLEPYNPLLERLGEQEAVV
jgi:hypothetical protein